MPQVLVAEQGLDALVAQVVPRQLEILDVDKERQSSQVAEILMLKLWDVLHIEGLDVLQKSELSDLLDNPILLVLVEQEVQIDG